ISASRTGLMHEYAERSRNESSASSSAVVTSEGRTSVTIRSILARTESGSRSCGTPLKRGRDALSVLSVPADIAFGSYCIRLCQIRRKNCGKHNSIEGARAADARDTDRDSRKLTDMHEIRAHK